MTYYKRIKSLEKNFKYGDIKNVYTIVLFEKSPQMFLNNPTKYSHKAEAKSDTGIELNLLQKYIFINLDIFKKAQHNKPISNKTEAWLTFLSSDEPEDIIRLIEECPEFKALYEDIYEICRNVEDIMGLFSKELQILDANTVQFMVDEMQDEIDKQKEHIDKQQDEIASLKEKNENQQSQIENQQTEISQLKDNIQQLMKRISSITKTHNKSRS